MRITAALAALLLPTLAIAQTCPPLSTVVPSPWDEVRLQWTASTWTPSAPTGAVVTYTVYRGATAVCTTTAVNTSLSSQPVGSQSYAVTAKSAQSVPANVESAKSNVATKTVTQPPVVNPPTNLTVIADPTAYEIRTSAGQLVAARIGRVELGTVCTQEAQTVSGVSYNRVEMRSVDLVVWPSASPNTVKAWARCG